MVEPQVKQSLSNGAPKDLSNDGFDSVCFPSEFEGLIFVRYLDHVLFSRVSALAMKPQVREAVGWLVYECDWYLTLAWDRDAEPPTLKGGDPKASGLVVLKSDIQMLKKLEPLQNNCYCHLNSASTNSNSEYALKPAERKTQPRTNKREG
jgi:hypothetical protein